MPLSVGLPAFSHSIVPEQTDPNNRDTKSSFTWVTFRSANVPHDKVGGRLLDFTGELGPAFGPEVWGIYFVKFVKGFSGRIINYHTHPADKPLGWNTGGGVSPFAVDYRPGPYDGSVTGLHIVCQPEGDINHRPYHYQLVPRPTEGRTYQLITRLRWSKAPKKDGLIEAWIDEHKVVSEHGLTTGYADNDLVSVWEGAYDSSGVSSDVVVEMTGGKMGRTFGEALADQPSYDAEVGNWHSVSTRKGVESGSHMLPPWLMNVQVPEDLRPSLPSRPAPPIFLEQELLNIPIESGRVRVTITGRSKVSVEVTSS